MHRWLGLWSTTSKVGEVRAGGGKILNAMGRSCNDPSPSDPAMSKESAGMCQGNCPGEQRLLPALISHKQQEPPSKHSLAVQILVPVLSHFPPGRRGSQHSAGNPSCSEASCLPGPLPVSTISPGCCQRLPGAVLEAEGTLLTARALPAFPG